MKHHPLCRSDVASLWAILLSGFLFHAAAAGELRFAGALGNSTESVAAFAGKTAPGMGPVFDDESAIWERGGSTRLNRYALDGRLLASFDLPESQNRDDQLTRVGNRLLLKLGRAIYTLALDAAPGTKPQRLEVAAEVMSSSACEGRVVLFDKNAGELFWFDPATGSRTPLAKPEGDVTGLHVGEDGTVFVFGGNQVRAWKDGQPVSGFPKEFRGERPQKIGDHWFSHTWHGTINRMNDQFEPEPGVVLGGASGSFIGYLPQSADLTNGRGLVRVRDDVFAVSGLGGVVQLLTWNSQEQRFEVSRRLGALTGLTGVALDAAGNIWTPRGSWRWKDTAEAPHSIGDKEPEVTAQPVVLGGKTLCLLKKHYQYVQLARGPLIDAGGWSRLETQGVPDFELPESVTGAAAVIEGERRRLVVATREGAAFELGIGNEGQLAGKPAPVSLPGLTECTSLAWFGGRLLAAGRGAVIVYEPAGANGWKEVSRLSDLGSGELFVHSDGNRLGVSDAAGGRVHLLDSLTSMLASYDGLASPGPLAVAGDRVAVYESGRQRLVRLEYAARPAPAANLTAAPAPAATGKSAAHTEADFQDVSRPAGLPLALALTIDPQTGVTLSVRTWKNAAVQIGVANAQQAWTLTSAQARQTDGQFDFQLPAGDWSQVRLATAIALPQQRERFGFLDRRAIHAPFDPDPATWAPFDLESYRERVHTRRQEIRLTFDQPVAGKATLVIEDPQGRRVRNLVSGRAFAAGRQTVVWDGLDERGTLVTPGTYRWRGITHPGIKPAYRMNFANGGEPTTESWGPNHSTLHAAAGNGKLVFFAAPVTEGGWGLLALDAAGRLVQGYEHQHGFGILHDAIAADDRYLYCAQDGFAWGGTKDIDPNRPDWKANWTITVVRYEIESGKLVEFPGKRRAIEVDTMEVGPGSKHPDLNDFNLGGLAVLDGKLYVGSRDKQAVLVFDAEQGERIEAIPLEGVKHLAAGKAAVFAATERGVVRLGDSRVVIPATNLRISGLAVNANGDLWVSDAASHQVRHFTADGKPAGVIGHPGGPYRGVYVPERMVHPAGLALGPDGKLWVTEKRWNPKRVLAWDLAKNTVAFEKFGMPHYGGDGSGFDPEDPSRWIGLGCFWDVDLDKRTARPTHVLSLQEGHLGGYEPHGYQFFREGGRTFVSTRGKLALVAEVLSDGTLRDLAATAGTHHFAYAFNWNPPQAYIDAFYARWPEKRAGEKPGKKGEGKPWSQRGMGVLWVDRNGDGEPQPAEFDFCGDQLDYAGGAWGHLQHSLTFSIPVADKTGVKVVSIAPRGFLANGVPDYPTLEEAIAKAATLVPLTPGYKRSGVSTVRDRFGRLLFNSDPEMNAYAADGSPLWTFPNQWSDVHGSHDAPLPEPGVMQGNMAFLGRASFDDTGDVVFLNGNHGRCFLLTTDGLYLDEAFVDVRVSYLKNEYRLGGEIFGGSFGRDEKSGRYLVQIGHGPYRIYELTGLDRVRRLEGRLTVTAEQIAAAERQSRRRVAERHQAKVAAIPGTLKWTKSGQFPVELKLEADASHLRLQYRVQDPSPWINHGRDWTKLFATGDTVDFQFATDAQADPKRRGPVPGDKRLVIGPFEGQSVAVLYEHRKPGGENPIEFTSPWRGEKVDDVRRLPGVRIDVTTSDGGYEVKAAIPLQAIGLSLAPAQSIRADFGVTYGDAGGTDTNLRSYWSNQSTGLVDDIPGEIMLSPDLWGQLELRKGKF
jgi:sugar lactone lactonase YvrE